MRKAFFGTTVLLLSAGLIGCNGPRSASGNGSDAAGNTAAPAGSGAAAPATAGDRVQPGEWNFVGRVSDVSMPGLPPAAALQMKAAMEEKMTSTTTCIRPEDAGRPPKMLFQNDRSGECRFPEMTMRGGKLSGTMICSRASRADPGSQTTMRMAINGSYTPTSYTIDQVVTFQLPGKPDGSAKMRVTGVRTGACRGAG